MKMKKIVASLAAAAMVVSSMAAMSVSAITTGATTVDFEDDDFSFVYVNNDDPKPNGGGSDASVLSVEEYNGSKQLKVDVQSKLNAAKIWFDLDKIMDRANTVEIRKITFDLTIVPKTAEGIVGWAGGAVGAAGGFDTSLKGSGQVDPSWNQGTWDGGAYDPGVAAEIKIERKFIMKNEFYTETGVNPFFGLMRWAASEDADEYVMYIDNIQFLDSKGKNLTVGVTPAAEETTAASEETTVAEETTAAAEETTTAAEADADATEAEEPEETEAEEPEETEAPETTAAEVVTTAAADTTTTPVATGNVAVASIAAVMSVAGVAAVVAKKRK